jgi:acetyl-CoA carboxylase carboxyltransferase component
MGGPAMIEGGGLGVFEPDEIGPIEVQARQRRGRRRRADEAEAVAVAKQYLSYFQGRYADWDARRPARCATRSPRTASAATTCAR